MQTEGTELFIFVSSSLLCTLKENAEEQSWLHRNIGQYMVHCYANCGKNKYQKHLAQAFICLNHGTQQALTRDRLLF